MITLVNFLLHSKIDFTFDSRRKIILLDCQYSEKMYKDIMSIYSVNNENQRTTIVKNFIVCSSNNCVLELI